MDSKLNSTLGKRLARPPKRLPRQASLPDKTQVKELFLDVESNHYSRIELPFGEPPEQYCLVAMKDKLKGACQWSLYRGDGEQSQLEWTVNANDWEQIQGRISALFPGWGLKNRTLASEGPATSIKPTNTAEAGTESTFFRTLEGDLRNLQIPNLVQTITMGKLTGRLQIQSRTDIAQMFFNDGTAVHCKLKNAEGEEAVIQLMGWEDGKFCFYPEPKTEIKTINKRLEFLIMEGAQFVDQYKALTDKGLSFDATVIRLHASITEEEFEKKLEGGTGIDLAPQKKLYLAIDNRSNLFELLRSQHLSQTEWVPILFNLINCGLIEFRSHESRPKTQSENKTARVEWSQIQLIEKSLTMPETGLYTYPTFLFFLDREFHRFERSRRPFSIVLLKIGSLPKNAATDPASKQLRALPILAIKNLGQTITRVKRRIDILAHYQAFDYALLLPETGKDAVSVFVDRLTEVLRLTVFQDIGPDETIDFTIGYASIPDDGDNPDALIETAWSRLQSK